MSIRTFPIPLSAQWSITATDGCDDAHIYPLTPDERIYPCKKAAEDRRDRRSQQKSSYRASKLKLKDFKAPKPKLPRRTSPRGLPPVPGTWHLPCISDGLPMTTAGGVNRLRRQPAFFGLEMQNLQRKGLWSY